jgi:alpha-beta hydrolase superfamily lysophospholipase
MTPVESELQLTGRGITSVPPDALSTVRTNAVADAAPQGRHSSRPLVVLSPGFTNARSVLTALAEDLASHGYVAAGIDHTYESFATAFPDGRVTTCLARETPRRGPAFWEKVVTGRAADVSFVLDELTGTRPAGPGAGLIDPARIGMAGHSAGGAAAIAALLADSRIQADLALLADQTGLAIGAGLPGARSLDITRAYVRAFFDQHLRGQPQPLLDHPSPSYPEVTFAGRRRGFPARS